MRVKHCSHHTRTENVKGELPLVVDGGIWRGRESKKIEFFRQKIDLVEAPTGVCEANFHQSHSFH